MGWQTVVVALLLLGPCAGVVAVAALALGHEALTRGWWPRRLRAPQTARRASCEVLREYLDLEGAQRPRRNVAAVVAPARRAGRARLHAYLAARRRTPAPATGEPARRPPRPTGLVPLSA